MKKEKRGAVSLHVCLSDEFYHMFSIIVVLLVPCIVVYNAGMGLVQ